MPCRGMQPNRDKSRGFITSGLIKRDGALPVEHFKGGGEGCKQDAQGSKGLQSTKSGQGRRGAQHCSA